ncbi:MAG: glycosyltransferase family 4 protein [Candidatus Aureabacteria bacterium]|nr:glycosyltransferase family 4 protein [Candidatus Auribacterota bacterium]
MNAGEIKVLMISLDETLLGGRAGGDAYERHVGFSKEIGATDIVVLGKKRSDSLEKGNLTVKGTGEKNLIKRFYAGYRIAEALARKNDYSLVTTQDPFLTGLVGYMVSKKFNIPLNIQLHADFLDNSYWIKENRINILLNIFAKYIIKKAGTARVVSSRMLDKLVSIGFNKDNVFFIPTGCGIPVENFSSGDKQRARDELGLPRDKKIVLFVGRLVRQKSLYDFIDTADALLKRRKDALFLIVGNGPERAGLKDYAAGLDLGTRLRFIDEVAYGAAAKYYRAADVFLLTSKYEGTARVLEEAAASSLPIITTAVSGAEDVVRDGHNGYIIPMGNKGAMADKLEALLENPQDMERMGRAGRLVAEKYYDRKKNIGKLIDMWVVASKKQ